MIAYPTKKVYNIGDKTNITPVFSSSELTI